MRTIAIGDIHGCISALNGLLERIEPRSSDTLIFLGDYVDRGPESCAVIKRLIELHGVCNLVFIRGNHDLVMQQWCEGQVDTALWETIGGQATLSSYGLSEPYMLPPEHIEFLANCVNYYETPTHIFVHGGYQPNLRLEETSLEHLLWSHLSWPLPRPHFSGKTVIVGHTPQTSGAVADFGHLVCIDTYCFGGGNLTAYDVDSRTALQVDFNGRLVRNWRGVESRTWFSRMMSWIYTPRLDSGAAESNGSSPQTTPISAAH